MKVSNSPRGRKKTSVASIAEAVAERTMFNHRHFPEYFTWTKPRKNEPPDLAGGDFHQTGLDEIDPVARCAFPENLLSIGKLAFLGNKPQRLQLIAVQKAEQRDGFQGHHGVTLSQICPA